MPSFLMIQWGVIGFFVGIHFLIGFLRGSSKSTYFTIVSIILTVITLWIVSIISFSWIFGSSFSLTSLLQLVQKYTGTLVPAEYITYLEDPALSGFIIAIMDLVLRIIAFVLLYPLIKFSLTLTIFRPIWKHGVKKALLKKQNEKQEVIFEEKDTVNKKFVPSKKLKKNVLGRFFGGAMGAVRGFVVAFVFLIPILVLSGYLSVVSTDVVVTDSSNQTLSTGNQQLIAIPSEIQDILDNINEMNQGGLSSITKDILIGGKPIEQYIFNRVFTTQVKQAADQVIELNFGEELEGIFGIAGILIDGGYLDDSFDYRTISSDNLDDIEQIFTYISNSDLLNFLIPFATEYGLQVGLEEFTDYSNPYDNPDAAAALELFTSIDWSDEFMNVYGIVEAVLTFGSVDELMNYADNPELLLEMTPTEAQAFTDIIRAMGDMQTLVLLNAGLGYAVTLEEVQSQITWVDPLDVEAYIQNRLGFILDDPDFFIGEDGEIDRFASLIETIFTDEYGDVDLAELFDSISDPAAFLDAQNPDWIGAIIDKVVDLQLIVEAIPIGVDYGVNTVLGDQMIEEQLAEDITTALDEIEWDAEIINIGDIYTEALQLGLSTAFGENADTFGFIDEVVANHMTSMRAIVTHIFDDSQVVNVAIEIASPALVDRFVTDDMLKDLVNEALISDPVSGVVDFNFGQEVNGLLTILESVYEFTTASELGDFSTMELDEKVELFSQFGSLTDTEFTAFEDAFKDLQLLDRMGISALDYAKDSLGIEELYVPSEVNLGDDVASVLGLAYYAAKYTYDNQGDYPSYEDIDFAPLLADDTFRSYLMATPLENNSNLLFTNIAYNIQRFSEDESMSEYIAIPTTLSSEDPEGVVWETEVNAFLGAILDLGASFEDSTVMNFSVHDVLGLTEDTSAAPMELFTQFADPLKAEDAFGSLDSSQILRTSLVNIIDTFAGSATESLGFSMTTPEIALDGEMLAPGMIVELINGLAIVASDAFETMGVTTLADVQSQEGTDAYLNAYSQLEDESLDALGDITIIRGMLSDVLLNPDMQSYLVDTMNDAQDLFVIEDDFFEVDPILLDTEGAVKAEEVSNLLIAVRSLGITDSEALSGLGLDTFTDLIDRNVDLDTGQDDFDRVFDSGILYITLDKVFQLDAIGTFVADTLSESLGTDMTTFDITPPDAMLGNGVDDEEIEVNRIPKDEFRRMMNSIGVLGDLSTIGLDTFSNLVDPTVPEDDFTIFITSDYIYVILARLFEDPAFGDYVGEMLNDAFGDDPITLTMSAPEDAKGTTGVEEDLMTRDELHNLMISFDMLGLSDGTDISIATIMDMIGANEDLAGEDDFDRFLESKYLDDKISQLLLSDQVIDLIGAGQFTAADFALPDSATEGVVGEERLTNQEIYDLFNGLNILGLSDFDNVDLGVDTLTSLSSTQVDQLLASTYLYVVVDLMIKSQDTFTLPDSAFETTGDYADMIMKDEVSDIFTALDILQITDFNNIDPATITIGNITDVIAQTDSAIVQSLLSQAIIDALDPSDEGKIPADAFEGDPLNNLLTTTEIDALIDALNILSGDDPDATIDSVDVNNITVGDVDALSDNDSTIIKQLISDAIVDMLGAGSIPDEAYGLSVPSNPGVVLLGFGTVQLGVSTNPRLTDAELEAMIDALIILANGDLDVLVTDITTDVNVGQAVQLKGTQSYIIKQLVTDNVSDMLSGTSTLPADAFVDGDVNGRLLDAEIDSMIDAMVILANGDMNLDVTAISTDINVGQVKDLVLLPSIVTKQLISDQVTDQIDPLDEGKIPDEARIGGISTNRLTDTEILAMVDALDILAGHDDNVLVTAISTDVNVGQTFELKGTASYIIKQLVTDNVSDMLSGTSTLPADAFVDGDVNGRLLDAEIDSMIDAMVILANGDMNLDVTAISTDINVGQVKDLVLLPSIVTKQLISDQVTDQIDPLDEGKIPDEARIGGISTNRLTDTEILAMVDALDILAGHDDNVLVTAISTDVNVGQASELKGTPSYIIKQLISDALVDTLGAAAIPNEAYISGDSNNRLLDAEIDSMIDALVILADGDNNLLVTNISTDINVGQVKDLDLLPSTITKKLISDAVVDAIDPLDEGKIPSDAYIGGLSTNRLTDTEITAMIDALDTLSGHDDLVLVSAITTDVTVGQVKEFKGTQSYIIKQLVSDAVVDTIGAAKVPDESYIGSDPLNRLTDTEIDAMIDALDILGEDTVLVTAISTDVNVGQAVAFKGTPSYIVKQLLSDAIIDAIDPTDAGKIPNDAHIDSDPLKRLTDTEIDSMIDAIEVLANGDQNLPVTSISTDVTIGQVKDLNELTSSITTKLISDAVIDAVGLANVPDDAYLLDTPGNNLKPVEIDEMILALEILAGKVAGDPEDEVDDVLVASVSTTVTNGQTQQLKTNDSVIIKQIVSDAVVDMIGAGDIPVDAYRSSDPADRLTDSEIVAMIDAVDILADGNDALLVSAIGTDVTIGQVKGLNDLTSLITEKLISDSIIDAVGLANVPDDAYLSDTPGNNLKAAEVDEMILALEILAGAVNPGDADAVLVSSVSTDVTIGQAQSLNTSPTGSSIIKFIISDSIITMITAPKIPADAYNTTYTDRLSDQEITDMLGVLSILGDPADPVSTIDTDINIGQLKSLNASPSLIIEKLISDSIIDAVGAPNVPLDAYVDEDSNNYLTEDEISAMILALEILAGSVTPGDKDDELVSSVSTDVTIGQTQSLDVSGTGSSIIKFIISDSIITMITAPKVPTSAYHLVYTDRLSDQEISDMLDVLGYLGAPTDPVSTIDTDINIGQLKSLNASPSLIIEKLISDSIIDAVGAPNVPLDAYVDEDSNNYLTEDEISAMILALEILAGSVTPGDKDDELVSSVSTDVTIGQTQSLDVSGTGSSIIKFIISDSIITMITAPKVPTSAYHLVYTDRLSDQEISDMLDVLGYLGAPTDPVSTIDVDITIGQLKDIQTSPSIIMTQLISDSIIDAVGLANVPDDAYISDTPGNNLKASEVTDMISALEVFAGVVVPGDHDSTKISDISTTNVTVGQTQDLSTNGSAIIKFIISDSVITMFGVGNIPIEAYHTTYTDRLSDEEIVAIADALAVLGGPNESVNALSTDVTVGQTQALDTTASGSVIIKQMISDSVVDMLGAPRIPDTAYIASNPANRLTDSEIGYMQDSLLPLAGGNSSTLVSAITVTESTLSVATLKSFPDQSIIMNRMISTAIISNLTNIPTESYVPLSTEDILRSEIDYLLDALDILGIGTDGAGSISGSAITFEDLYTISAYGESDPLGYSPIIDHILSTPMISAVSDVRSGYDYGIPSTAYRNTYDLLHYEIVSLIDALATIGGVAPVDYPTTTLADITVNPSGFNATLLNSLITINSRIVYRLISIGINDAGLDNDDAYAEIGDFNYDPVLNALPTPVLNDIKVAEMNHIVTSMNILDPTGTDSLTDIIGLITVAKLKSLTAPEIETLVEAGTDGPNTIIYYIISSTVDSTNTLYPDDNPATYNPVFDSGYVMDGGTRVRLERASIAAALLLL